MCKIHWRVQIQHFDNLLSSSSLYFYFAFLLKFRIEHVKTMWRNLSQVSLFLRCCDTNIHMGMGIQRGLRRDIEGHFIGDLLYIQELNIEVNKNCSNCHSVCSSLVSDAKQNSVILKYLNVQMERNIEFELMVYSILNKTLSSPSLSLPASHQHRLPTADSVKDF